MKKIKIGVIFGGCSPEHEISLLSAHNVMNCLDPKKYEIVPIGIDKSGKWLLPKAQQPILNSSEPDAVCINPASTKNLSLVPGQTTELTVVSQEHASNPGQFDVIFPVLHGPLGEDGTMQGLLRFVGLPCVGAPVMASAMCMDKEITKFVLNQKGIGTAAFICLRTHERNAWTFDQVVKKLGAPFFVKPANLGSSVGVTKVKKADDFREALDLAFQYDHKVLVEEAIIGQEVEIGVLGNDDPQVSVVGEVHANDEFYTYKAKYNEGGVRFEIPAKLSDAVIATIQDYAKRAFLAFSCKGMARVDFFVRGNNVYLNELNTIPGFTATSAYPALWKASGVSNPELVDRLVNLAIEDFEKDKKLKRDYL